MHSDRYWLKTIYRRISEKSSVPAETVERSAKASFKKAKKYKGSNRISAAMMLENMVRERGWQEGFLAWDATLAGKKEKR